LSLSNRPQTTIKTTFNFFTAIMINIVIQSCNKRATQIADNNADVLGCRHAGTQTHRYASRKDKKNRHTGFQLCKTTTRRITDTGTFKHKVTHLSKHTRVYKTIQANTRSHRKFKHTSMQAHMSRNAEKHVVGYRHGDIRYQHVCQHTHAHTHTHTLTLLHAAQEHRYGY
jgi:hypothetical protein